MEINFITVSSLSIILITLLLLVIFNIFKPLIRLTPKLQISSFWLIPFIGALLLIILGNISISNIYNNLTSSNSINPLKVLILFFSMTFLSIFLDEIGFFKYVVYRISIKLKSNQYKLFFGLYALISLLTLFTSNDIIILTFTPFICYLTKESKINPIPYLIMEFISANTMSMALIIGNPTNIYLASSFNITFINYLLVMILPTISSSLISILIMYALFKKDLSKPLNIDIEKIDKPNKFLLIIGLSILLSTTLILSISNYIFDIEMYLIALLGSLIELLIISIYSFIKKNSITLNTIKRLPYNLIPFILSMFVIVICLNNIGFTSLIRSYLSNSNIFIYGYSGLIVANLINNIPMAVLYSYILDMSNIKFIYASIIASNIAAYITPLGALAGLMFINLTSKYDIKISFKDFTKYGLIIGIPSISIALFVLYLI